MRIASGSALFVACLVVASSANGKSEDTSVILPPQRDGRRVASVGNPKKRGLYGDLSIDGAAENVQLHKVTPVLDRLSSHPGSKGLESTSDRPQDPLEDLLYNSTGNLSKPLEDSCASAATASPSEHPNAARVRSDQFAFPSDICSLEPTTGVHVYPPLYSGPPNTPLMGSAAVSLSHPPLSRALAHCSTSLSIWCSENQKAAHLADPPGIYAESPTAPHDECAFYPMRLPGKSLTVSRVDQAERMCECHEGTDSRIGTHIVDGGWVSNLVQTLSS